MATVRFNERAVRQAYERRVTAGMQKAVRFGRAEAVKLVNRGQPTRATRSGQRVGLDPSKPGEPPKVVTGRLKTSITSEVRKEGLDIVGRIGSPVEYAHRLEFGFVGTDARGRTVSQAPRPFLRPVLRRHRARIVKLIAGG